VTRFAVVGLGLIGGSVLRRLAAERVDAAGWDPDATVRREASAAGLAVADDPAGITDVQTVVVGAPPAASARAITDALARWPEAVVFDTASVKTPIAVALRSEGRGRVLLGHPLAGSERAGFAASDSALFEGAVWAACPLAENPVERLCDLSVLTDALGSRIAVLSPERHDSLVARTSHVPHLVAAALAASAVGNDPLAAVLSGGALRDMTRVARADAGLWEEILRLNRPQVLDALAAFGERLDSLEAGDLREGWSEGAEAASLLHRLRWGETTAHEERHALAAGWEPWLALSAKGATLSCVRREADVIAARVARPPRSP